MKLQVTSLAGWVVGYLEYDDVTGRWVAETCYGTARHFNLTAHDEAQGASVTVPPQRAEAWVMRQHYGQVYGD